MCKNTCKKIDIEIVDDSIIGKQVFVLVKYPQLLFGNIHSDFLFIGTLIKSIHSHRICLHDTRINKCVFISKKRFHGIVIFKKMI